MSKVATNRPVAWLLAALPSYVLALWGAGNAIGAMLHLGQMTSRNVLVGYAAAMAVFPFAEAAQGSNASASQAARVAVALCTALLPVVFHLVYGVIRKPARFVEYAVAGSLLAGWVAVSMAFGPVPEGLSILLTRDAPSTIVVLAGIIGRVALNLPYLIGWVTIGAAVPAWLLSRSRSRRDGGAAPE
jgi:hypothetical protein